MIMQTLNMANRNPSSETFRFHIDVKKKFRIRFFSLHGYYMELSLVSLNDLSIQRP